MAREEIRQEREKIAKERAKSKQNIKSLEKNPNEQVRIIVQTKQDSFSDSRLITRGKIQNYQNNVKNKLEKFEGAKITQTYRYLLNGFGMTVKRSEISKIRALPWVKSVTEAKVYYPVMTSAKEITKIYEAWNNFGYKGEGMVISVIDSGIDVEHKDMKLTDYSKAKIKNIKQSKETKFTEKVPYGHNFADQNDDVKDGKGKSMHGMHVAGIIGANGEDEEISNLKAIKGVAPEAQLLAMKVFSNNPEAGGCYDDDIIAAIEDSVVHDADIINMSLGSPAGFSDPNDPVAIAIKKATDQGTLVVVAAGNDGISSTSSTYEKLLTNDLKTVDTSMVSSPATANDALTVASYENNDVIDEVLEVEFDGKVEEFNYIASERDPGKVLKGNKYELVDCGTGGEFDYWSTDVYGKIAVVKFSSERGSQSIRENAQKAGAKGVIIYSDDGDETLHGMYPNENLIPAAWVSNSSGKKIISAAENAAKVSFNGKIVKNPNELSGNMSNFTSFGPTPNLEIKPEVTAPGGSIFSTVNNNSYEKMSGTSMATPHTAGAAALVVQAVKDKLKDLSGRQLVEFAKRNLINTSKVVLDKNYGEKNVPYSPRAQGAGLIQIDDAINNKVLATDKNNNAVVALKEIGKSTSFTLKLKNYGDEAVSYDISTEGVLGEKILDEKGHFKEYVIPNADINFSKKSITVNAKEEVYVDVNLNLPANLKTESFVEGYIHFNCKDGKNPSLNVPYVGFYGDWGKPSIIDAPMHQEDSLLKITGLISEEFFGVPIYLGGRIIDENNKEMDLIDPNTVAISPNGDDNSEVAKPCLGLLRNVKEMTVEIVDKNDETGKVLRRISYEEYIRKASLERDGGQKIYYSGKWDGKLYNDKTGKYELAKDGQYYVKITSKVDLENAKPQVMYLPVKVDIKEPEVKIISNESDIEGDVLTLRWTVKEEGSGIYEKGTNIYVNGENGYWNLVEPIKKENGVYSCKVKIDTSKSNLVAIAAVDNAVNIGVDTLTIGRLLKFENLEDNLNIGKEEIKDGVYTVKGVMSKDIKSIAINDNEAKVSHDGSFAINIPVEEGDNELNVVVKDNEDKVIENLSKTYSIVLDTKEPIINITSPIYKDGEGVICDTDELVIKGTVKDDRTPYDKLKVKIGWSTVELNEDGSFETTVRLYDANNSIDILAEDLSKNTSVVSFGAGKEEHDLPFSIHFENLSSLTLVAPVLENVTEDGIYTIKGFVSKRINTFRINDQDVKVNNDLSFSFPVKLDKVFNKVKVYAADANGKVYYNYAYDILYDGKAPNIKITEPIENADGKVYTNKDVVKVKGIAEDNGLGYSLSINGENLVVFTKIADTGEEKSRKEFEKDIKVEDGSVIKIECEDAFENYNVKEYKVVVDKKAPVVKVSGIEEGKVYNSSVKPEISVDEEECILAMELDGKEYVGGPIEEEGKHTLSVKATDRAGNVSDEYKISFTIDKTAPEITVTGVEDGKVYTEEVIIPEVKTNEKSTIVMTLDGKAYDGKEIKELGKHVLVITAVDEAGNKSQKTISFTIEEKGKEKPGQKDENGKENPSGKPSSDDGKVAPGQNSGNKSGNSSNSGKLVQTGSAINFTATVLGGLAVIFMGASLIYISKRRES